MKTAGADTRAATVLMALTYAVAAAGIGFGFSALSDADPDLGLATLLAVGAGGILSFVRHAVFHRADAARIGWTAERTNGTTRKTAPTSRSSPLSSRRAS